MSGVAIRQLEGNSVNEISAGKLRPSTSYINISARLKNACCGFSCAPKGPDWSAKISYSISAPDPMPLRCQVVLSDCCTVRDCPAVVFALTQLTYCEKSRTW